MESDIEVDNGAVAPVSANTLSTGDIRARLSGTQPPREPARVDIEVATRDWRPGFRERLSEKLVPAAVLIPIVDRANGPFVLLARRSSTLKHHAGQIAFPGGRMEPCDADVVETALRETEEEIGVQPRQVEAVGFLPPVPTLTGYAVTPVVGLLDGSVRLTLDRTEIESVLEVPLGFLLDPANQRPGTRDVEHVAVPVELHFEGQRIWGVTASIVVALRDRLLHGGTFR